MKKLSFFIVLAVVYSGSTFGMVDQDFTEQMYKAARGEPLNAPPLQGCLKPIATALEHNLERYHRFEASNPRLAEPALAGAITLGKGLYGAGSGAILCGTIGGAICGPHCAVTGAAAGARIGFRSGTVTGIIQEISGKIVHGVVGKPLDAIVNTGVDVITPVFMKLDGSLDEQDARILAFSMIGTVLPASEFKAVSKGIWRSVRTTGRPHAPALEPSGTDLEHASAAGLELGSRYSAYKHIHAMSHTVEAGLPGAALERMTAQGHQEAPAVNPAAPAQPAVDALDAQELFEQAKQDLECILTEIVQEEVSEDIKTSQQVGLIERHADQSAIARQMHDLFEKEKANIRYEITRNTIHDTFEGFSAIMSIAGNHKVAHQITTVGNAGVKIMDSCRMLAAGTSSVATGASALAGLGGAAMTASCICPYVGIACAVASLVSLFDDDSDGLGEALAQMHRELSQQISVVHDHMMQRFDHLESKVDSMHMHMVQGFLKVLERFDYLGQKVDCMHVDMIQGFVDLSQQMQDFTDSTAYSFEHINSDLQALHEINAKVDSLLLMPFVESCAAIERYPSRFGKLSTMDEHEVVSHYKTLENGLLGISPTYDYLNGHVCADFSPTTINRILTSSSPESLLGYLAKYSTSQLGVPLPSTVRPAQLPNLSVFARGLQKYLILRRATTHIPYDVQCKALQEITSVGDHALTFIDSIQGNKILFEKLYAHYSACYTKTLALYYQALENKSQEILDMVHANAVEKTSKAIETFPLAPVVPKGIVYCDTINTESLKDQKIEQDGLRVGLDWFIPKKSQFKVDLAQSAEELLANPDNTILNAIVLPELSCSEQCASIPLDFRPKAPILESYISKHALIAERLGLGTIELKYVENPDSTISVKAMFRKKDNTELAAGGATLTLSPSESAQALRRYKGPSLQQLSVSELRSAFNRRMVSARGFPLPKFKELASYVKFLWTVATSSAPAGVAPDHISLMKLISEGLIEHRQAALASLSASTQLGIRYQQRAEELKSSYHALKAFGTIAGLSKEKIHRILGLVTDDANSYLHACMENIPANTSLRTKLEGALVPATRVIRACITPVGSENSFSMPLRTMLTRLGHFATMYPGIAQQKQAGREQLAQRAQAAREAALQVPTARELALTQELSDVKVQMAAMMGMMQQMQQLLLQQKRDS
jgi:hypothetical protein